MEDYDKSKEKKENEEMDKIEEPDEDGWVTVTSKSRKANAMPMTQRNVDKLKFKQNKKQQKMVINIFSFYFFCNKISKQILLTFF